MIPFRIVKADGEEGNPMFDFGKVFKIAEPVPAVIAVVVPKETEAGTARIEAAGFSTKFKQEVDGAVAYLQQEDIELGQPDQVIVKFDESLSAVVRLKRFEPFGDSTSFDENLQKNGFLPGFDMALTVLRDTVFNALFEADDVGVAGSTIDTAVKQFRAHVADMTAALPETAFKLDPAVLFSTREDLAELITATKGSVVNFTMRVETGPETSVGAPSITSVDSTQTEGGEEVAVSPAVSGSSSSLRKEDGKEGDETTNKDTSEATEVAAKDESQDGEGDEGKSPESTESDTSEIQKQIEAQGKLLADGLASISTTLKDAVEGINTQVAALSERVEKTEENVNGTANVVTEDDPEATARKSNGAGEPQYLDTGWDRLRAD
jgi:hypothetical protein